MMDIESAFFLLFMFVFCPAFLIVEVVFEEHTYGKGIIEGVKIQGNHYVYSVRVPEGLYINVISAKLYDVRSTHMMEYQLSGLTHSIIGVAKFHE